MRKVGLVQEQDILLEKHQQLHDHVPMILELSTELRLLVSHTKMQLPSPTLDTAQFCMSSNCSIATETSVSVLWQLTRMSYSFFFVKGRYVLELGEDVVQV
jgi:hypothetical protein